MKETFFKQSRKALICKLQLGLKSKKKQPIWILREMESKGADPFEKLVVIGVTSRWRHSSVERKQQRRSRATSDATSFHDGWRPRRNIFQLLSRFSFFLSTSACHRDMAGLASPLNLLGSLMSTCPRKGTENGWNLGLGTFARNQVS